MLKAYFKPYRLNFKTPAVTSRGQMKSKKGYYLFVSDGEHTGVGECSFIEGLGVDDLTNYEKTLLALCSVVENNHKELPDLTYHPSIQFGYECALLDLQNAGQKILFKSDFTDGKANISINGLIWMGNKEEMLDQVKQKIDAGYTCIKLKVGAIDFDEELSLLKYIRAKYSAEVVEIRVDANGAWNENLVFNRLHSLAKFDIHSIEQPVRHGQNELLRKVCSSSPIAVALDEELIYYHKKDKQAFLEFIKPSYLVLKPSLLGGFKATESWIEAGKKCNIEWWATSALESNIGLNAIAQWTDIQNNPSVQGLGTGGLYTNNISSPLHISKASLGYNPELSWGNNFPFAS